MIFVVYGEDQLTAEFANETLASYDNKLSILLEKATKERKVYIYLKCQIIFHLFRMNEELSDNVFRKLLKNIKDINRLKEMIKVQSKKISKKKSES